MMCPRLNRKSEIEYGIEPNTFGSFSVYPLFPYIKELPLNI